jgi:hypothetical protein
LGWVPYGAGDGSSEFTYLKMKIANLTTITQLPHVEIDLAKQTHVTLDIPYTFILPAIEFSQSTLAFPKKWGLAFIVPYSPLIPGSGGSTCPYTLWVSMQNTEFVSASANQGYQFQMNPGEREAKAMGLGPVSGTLTKVSKATNILGQIPIIGTWATQVSWITDVLAQGAKVMGWSKPLNLTAPIRIVRQALPFSANADVTVNSHPMGVQSENSVVPHSGISGTTQDEMSYDFIKSQYAFLASTSWDASATAGSTLYTVDIIPSNFSNVWSKGVTFTPVGFLAALHTYYRGGFVFRIKLVKTEFHRGRLLIAFSPATATQTSTTFSYTNSQYVYREIVDVSTTSEFEVCTPYMSVRPFMATDATIGRLTIFVENALTAPSSVASAVPMIVEVKGFTDLRFACPKDTAWEPYSPSTYQMADPYVATPCFTLGVSTPAPDTESFTIGETLTSFRQILKRMYGWNLRSGAPFSVNAANALYFRVYHLFCTTQATGTTGALARGVLGSDLINLVSWCYAFQTGSMRLMLRLASVNLNIGVQVLPQSTSIQQYASLATPGINNDKTYIPVNMEGVVDVQIPVWQPVYARAVPLQTEQTGTISFVDQSYGNGTTVVFTSSDVTVSTTAVLYRTIGEDFSMFRWTGVPPLCLSTAT